jgi:HemK-related putative methylase
VNLLSTIYEPQEDSFLLAEQVKKYAKGKVLDMGCGSGIQGITASNNKNVIEVTFADINIDAITHLSNNIKLRVPSYHKHTNLFSKINRKYDTIIFNPPYLPKDEMDKETLITTGGKEGYELLAKFLRQAKKYLSQDGIILIVFSSLTNKARVDGTIQSLSYEKLELSKASLFMEQLYVYQLKIHNPNIIKGHRGIVEIKGNVAIKKSLTVHYNSLEETKFLRLLNKHGIGPKYISHTKNSLKMEYINGDRILEYIKKSSKNKIITIIDRILEQLYTMDKLKINKQELTNPYKHIIVRDHIPIMIDFERCQYTDKPKNITQFIQFLNSGKMIHILKEKGMTINKEKLTSIAKNYKKKNDIKYLAEIISCVV